jgi:hypothetical protein
MADFGSKITNIFIMKHIKRSIYLNKFRGSLFYVLMTVGATSGARTAYPSEVPEFTTDLCRVCVAHSVVFNVVLLLFLFHLSFFFWPLYFLFFDLWLLITSLVSTISFFIKEPALSSLVLMERKYAWLFSVFCHSVKLKEKMSVFEALYLNT